MGQRKATKAQIKAAMKGSGGIYLQILQNLKRIVNAQKIDEHFKTLSKLDEKGKSEAMQKFVADLPDVMTRQAMRERVTNDDDLQALMLAESELLDDLGESAFARALQAGQPWAVKQWLKYKGRGRNYIPAMKMDHTTDDKPLPPTLIYFPEQIPYNELQQMKGAANAQPQTQPAPAQEPKTQQ